MSELKAKDCPFECPNPDIKLDAFDGNIEFRVYCAGCNCSGPWKNSRDEALKAWNTRPREGALEGALREARYALKVSVGMIKVTREQKAKALSSINAVLGKGGE